MSKSCLKISISREPHLKERSAATSKRERVPYFESGKMRWNTDRSMWQQLSIRSPDGDILNRSTQRIKATYR